MAKERHIRDILIAGGGPVGAMLALALRECGASVLQVRSAATGSDRPIALSYGSRLLLEREGVWPAAPPTPIGEIHVSQQGAFGRTLIRAADYALPALGYVAAYSNILAWLSAAGGVQPCVEGKVIDWTPGTDDIEVRVAGTEGNQTLERTRLLVIADGGIAGLAGIARDYGQHAIVADIRTERPHRNIAWERFAPGGPIALLPFHDRHALVWSMDSDTARSVIALPEAEFLLRLGAAFGRRLGEFLGADGRASFPLALRHRHAPPAPRTVLIGNAAQMLHPVAGQGLNLGLRDAVELAQLVAKAHPRELGGDAFLRRYAGRRGLDRAAGIRFTDALVRLFSNSNTALAAARGAGLAFLDIVPPARGFLARRMIYGARTLP